MVQELKIHPATKTESGWRFRVELLHQPHVISVSSQHWQKLTRGDLSPMELVRIAVEVALAERSPQVFPPETDLRQLAELIPDFEKMVRARAKAEVAGNPR